MSKNIDLLESKKLCDALGEVNVPKNALYGTTTARALINFKVGEEIMPISVIRAITLLKKSCAIVNNKNKKLSKAKLDAIANACDEITLGTYDDEFRLSVWQTGSGTSSNMNVNEVIAGLAQKKKINLHPNDDVNMGQSSNDIFPSAMNIATILTFHLKLLPTLELLKNSFEEIEIKYKKTRKIARTHLQDAVPMTVGQEFSAFKTMISEAIKNIKNSIAPLLELPIGGTAVGTGINTTKTFGKDVAKIIKEDTGFNFKSSPNKFYGLSSKSNYANFHGSLKALATDLIKIANDIRWLASGPRAGLSELIIPANEPGSSIMPGKVNPTQCEMLTQVCAQVIGNDTAISYGASSGNFQLNVFMPLIIHNTLKSLTLLSDAIFSFNNNLVVGIDVNIRTLAKNIENSLMLITALTPKIGYDLAAKIAKKAHQNNTSIKDEILKEKLLSEKTYDKLIKDTLEKL